MTTDANNFHPHIAQQIAALCTPQDPSASFHEQIDFIAEKLEAVYLECMDDRFDLYYRVLDDVVPGRGTWAGQVARYRGLQDGLRKVVEEARRQRCAVSHSAPRVLERDAPAQPDFI